MSLTSNQPTSIKILSSPQLKENFDQPRQVYLIFWGSASGIFLQIEWIIKGNFLAASFTKLADGGKCLLGQRVETESLCKNAANELGLTWASSWNGPSDVPGCIFANDGRKLVYFNTVLTATGSNPKYAEICKGRQEDILIAILYQS